MQVTEPKPLIMNPRKFWRGVVALVLFLLVLIPLFTPVFDGRTGMEAADDIFNELAKGSADYLARTAEEAAAFQGREISVTLSPMGDMKPLSISLLDHAGIPWERRTDGIALQADLGLLLAAVLADAHDLFHLHDEVLVERHGVEQARMVLFTWHRLLRLLEAELTVQRLFEKAQVVRRVSSRAVEPAYNFSGITPTDMRDRLGLTTFLLIFYVLYTVWYGVAILYLFEGFGITATRGRKKEH